MESLSKFSAKAFEMGLYSTENDHATFRTGSYISSYLPIYFLFLQVLSQMHFATSTSFTGPIVFSDLTPIDRFGNFTGHYRRPADGHTGLWWNQGGINYDSPTDSNGNIRGPPLWSIPSSDPAFINTEAFTIVKPNDTEVRLRSSG